MDMAREKSRESRIAIGGEFRGGSGVDLGPCALSYIISCYEMLRLDVCIR
jgi:hypothetical protein